MEANYGTPTNKAASGSAVATFTEAVDDSGGSTAFGVASGGPGVTATVDSTAANMATPANAGLPCRPEAVAELPVLDVIGHRRGGGGGGIGGQPRGRGRGRRRGAFRNNYRGGFNQGRGGYDSTASSSYTLTQTRQAYGNRQTGWDSASQEVQYPLDTQQPQRGGRGRGGYGIGQQQNVVRRPSRGSGRSRASSSRSRRLEYDQPQQEAQNIVVLNEGGERSARYPGHGAEEVEATMQGETTPPQQDDSRATVYLRDMSVASIESITLPTAVLEPHSLKSDDSTPSILTRVRPERRLSLITETPADATPSEELVTSTSNPIHWQDLAFQGISTLVHPGHAREMVYAWYPFAVVPGSGEGAHLSSLPSPLPIASTPPPLPPSMHQQPPMHPPAAPHFHFTHDHAFLALCHPVPAMPFPWFPIPYLRYWGPERLGAHPKFYDIPMVSLTLKKAMHDATRQAYLDRCENSG